MATILDPHFRDLLSDLIEQVQLLDGVDEPGEVHEDVREAWATSHCEVIGNIVAKMADADIAWNPDADQVAREGEMDILVLPIVTAVIAGGGLWMISRPSNPTERQVRQADLDNS